MTEEKKPFIVKLPKSKWLRGAHAAYYPEPAQSSLLNDYGESCCIGHLCLQLGIPSEKLRYMSYVHSLVNPQSSEPLDSLKPRIVHDELPELLKSFVMPASDPSFFCGSERANVLYRANDDPDRHFSRDTDADERRVDHLNKLALPLGIQFELVP
jgi:hypothetical protein